MSIDYGEIICQAVDTIVSERLNGISYDTTILCTIEDDSRREDGVYIVSNGSTKFEAYTTDTSFRKGTNVYVQIPSGDWNQQKIITAKKIEKEDTTMVYISPFSQLVDITGNLLSGDTSNGLVANGDITEVSVSGDVPVAVNYSEFTRLGVQAQFRAWLNPMGTTEGEYGLRIYITGSKQKTVSQMQQEATEDDKVQTAEETESETKKEPTIEYIIELSSYDMQGNPYNFENYFQQEKVLDISSLKEITSIRAEFYQEKNFKDAEGVDIPAKDNFQNPVAPNLFIKDVYITLGYDVSEFDDEMVRIYSLNSPTYVATAEEGQNNKLIGLRWIHKLEDGNFKSIKEEDTLPYDYEVRWYRYKLGAPSVDEYSGVYWEMLAIQKNNGEVEPKMPAGAEWIENGLSKNFFEAWLVPDTNRQNEQIKAVLLYNNKYFVSNILTFSNEKEVINQSTIDVLQALSVQCDDNGDGICDAQDSFGNYRIYNLGNVLLDQHESQLVRQWIPYFKVTADGLTAAPSKLTEAESIEWIIPTKNTMIKINESFYSDITENKDRYIDEDGRLHLIRYPVPTDDPIGGFNDNFVQQYQIGSYYSQTYSDNTIQCIIVKNGITYSTTKEMTFGPAGTTGTDCTFILDFDDGATCIRHGSSATTVTARLYDENNKEVDISKYSITWSWRNSDADIWKNEKIKDFISIKSIDSNGNSYPNYKRELQATDSNPDFNYHILQATLSGWGDYDLIAYLPIPFCTSTNYSHISGPTKVIYDSSGELLDYFQAPYELYLKSGLAENDVSWIIKYYNQSEESIGPKLQQGKDSKYRLTPPSVYIDETCQFVRVLAQVGNSTIWSQPLLIMKNRYPIGMVNKWDGSLVIDKKNNAIFSASMIAGSKNKDNQFSGVILGDIGKSESNAESGFAGTGLYGYSDGEQAYAFKGDGTGFIGKDGSGRIKFDGNESSIYSAGYDDGYGMMINLGKISKEENNNEVKIEANGYIEYKKGKQIIFKLNSDSDDAYLQINSYQEDSDNPITLMYVDDDSYYLKSANFDEDYIGKPFEELKTLEAKGTYFNLQNGDLYTANGYFRGHIEADTGTFYGGINIDGTTATYQPYDCYTNYSNEMVSVPIYREDGSLDYKTFQPNSAEIINGELGFLGNIQIIYPGMKTINDGITSLNGLLAMMYSTDSHLMALSTQNSFISNQAAEAASQAQSAIDKVENQVAIIKQNVADIQAILNGEAQGAFLYKAGFGTERLSIYEVTKYDQETGYIKTVAEAGGLFIDTTTSKGLSLESLHSMRLLARGSRIYFGVEQSADLLDTTGAHFTIGHLGNNANLQHFRFKNGAIVIETDGDSRMYGSDHPDEAFAKLQGLQKGQLYFQAIF